MLTLIEKRNRDFIDASRKVIAAMKANGERHLMTFTEIAIRTAAYPAPCYYVSHEYALRVLRVMRHGRLTFRRDRRREMFEELDRKVRQLQDKTGMSLNYALWNVLEHSSASSFFINPSTAVRLMQYVQNPKYKKR